MANGVPFAQLDYNLFFANSSGPCNGCPAQPNAVFLDPLFVDAAANDYRLRCSSPAVDAGFDLLVDVNGHYATNYNAAAPDLGAIEARP